jgi:DNA-binding HxlR family transcriptional regulator
VQQPIYALALQWKEGTGKIHTYPMESDPMAYPARDARSIPHAQAPAVATPQPQGVDPRVEALVTELIGRVADKWTMIVLEVLAEHGELRFTQLSRLVTGVSQKMLTQTLRRMERDGMVVRTVHAVVPPRVDYRLTDMGASLGEAFCGVWIWAEQNLARVESARRAFDQRAD